MKIGALGGEVKPAEQKLDQLIKLIARDDLTEAYPLQALVVCFSVFCVFFIVCALLHVLVCFCFAWCACVHGEVKPADQQLDQLIKLI